jgi:hypothetical protein
MVPMQERNGVRLGQRVRDADGLDLGRVTALYAWGFKATRGLPVLTRRDEVVRYDEVRGVRDGALVVARSAGDLLDLAAGGVPRSWRIPAPPGYPASATPSEARLVLEDIAAGAAFSPSSTGEPLVAVAPEAPPIGTDEERAFAQLRGQAAATAVSDSESTRSRSSSSTNPAAVLPRPSR